MTSFKKQIPEFKELIDGCLKNTLPDSDKSPKELSEAMAYSVMNGGKRIRNWTLLALKTSIC